MDEIIIMNEKERVWFKCSKCGAKAWFEINLAAYIVSVDDLICDDCNPVEDE